MGSLPSLHTLPYYLQRHEETNGVAHHERQELGAARGRIGIALRPGPQPQRELVGASHAVRERLTLGTPAAPVVEALPMNKLAPAFAVARGDEVSATVVVQADPALEPAPLLFEQNPRV